MPKQKQPEDQRGEDVASAPTAPAQFGIGEADLDDAEQVEDADDQRPALVSLNRQMKVLTMPGITIFSACGRMISRIVCQ